MQGDGWRRGFVWVWITGLAIACGSGDDGSQEDKAPETARFEGVLVNPTGAASVMWVNTLCEGTGSAEIPDDCADVPSGLSELRSDGGFTLELRKGYDFRLAVMTETGTVHGTIALCGQSVLSVPSSAPDAFDFGSCEASGEVIPQYVPENTPDWMCD